MLTTPIEIGLDSKTWDNQSLDNFRNCPMLYFWRIEKKVVKVIDKKTAADFGSAIHSALECWYKGGMTDEAMVTATSIFMEKFAPHQDEADEMRTLLKGTEILMRYFERYRHEPFNVVATEVGGAVELGDYIYCVRMDLITEWLNPKGIYGFDHKSSSSIGRMSVKPHNQITGYIYTLQQSYENVIGFMMNVIGVYKDEEVVDKAAPKVVSSKTGKLIYAKKERETLLRMPTTRTTIEIETWKRSILHTIHQIEECRRVGVWPMYDHYCKAFKGECAYHDLCLAQEPEKMLEPLIASEVYKYQPWTPYNPTAVEGEEVWND